MLNRRHVLSGALASAALGVSGVSRAQARERLTLTAQRATAQLLETGEPATDIWGYNGGVPGPVIRAKQGETFAAALNNALDQPTTIHWHGIRIDNAMDGVAGLTQPAVQPGERFTYRFTPPDAGTFWYHPHNRTWEQLARGLYGALVVEELKPPAVDQDRVLMFDDWRLTGDGAIDERTLGAMHDLAHAGRLGNILTLNGRFEDDIAVRSGERLRLRLVNAANARVLRIGFPGHFPVVVAVDGHPVGEPFVTDDGMVRLAPAQRCDVIVDCVGEVGTATDISVDTGRETLRLGRLVYDPKRRARATTLADVPVLPPSPMPAALDLDGAVPVNLEMTGGARAPFDAATYRGERLGIRELARRHQKVWAFNGIVGFPLEPIKVFDRGRTAVFRMVNRTAWPHAMHFHGHHVREVHHSARAPSPHWRDTVLVERGEAITVAFVAHNPGKWMLHCHMLEHQKGGMSTWYEVT